MVNLRDSLSPKLVLWKVFRICIMEDWSKEEAGNKKRLELRSMANLRDSLSPKLGLRKATQLETSS